MPYAFRKDFTKVNLPYSSYGYNVYSEISPGQSQDYVFDLADFGDSSSAGGSRPRDASALRPHRHRQDAACPGVRGVAER